MYELCRDVLIVDVKVMTLRDKTRVCTGELKITHYHPRWDRSRVLLVPPVNDLHPKRTPETQKVCSLTVRITGAKMDCLEGIEVAKKRNEVTEG